VCYVKGAKIILCRKAFEKGAVCKKVISKIQIEKTYTLWHKNERLDPYYYTITNVEDDTLEAVVALIHPAVAQKNNICNATMPVTIHLI